MKYLLSIFLILFSSMLLADEVKVEINPPRPVAGEVFQAYFRVFTESEDEPAINFSPWNVEVVGKSNQGVSTRAIYANGKYSVTREVTIAYDLVSAKAGSAALRDINVQVAGKTIRHQTMNLTVLKEAQEQAGVFLMADVPKKSLFIGEGILVRYWLYSKVQITGTETKKYPKLNNFLKRFLQEPDRGERVLVNGEIFNRNLVYAARLYPEKLGDLTIDPVQVSVTYAASRANDPFGAFGLHRDFKTKTLNSESVKINVKPLPEPIPPHYTGLIGKHDFDLQVGQSRLIVNEPLELKLTVTGSGALENMEPPALLSHPGLEEFETNGDLKIVSPEQATKTFDYTYLAKENLTLPAKPVMVSYFDPDSEKFVSVELKLPEIVVAGGQPGQTKKDSASPKKEETTSPKKSAQVIQDLTSPISFEEWQWKNWLPVVNVSLAVMALLLSIGWVVKVKGIRSLQLKSDVPGVFKAEFNFSEFVKWMTPLIRKSGKSPLTIIKESDLPEESKRYFIDLLTSNDYKEYSTRKSELDYKYQASHYKKLSKYIESAGHESSSQPS